MKKKNRKFMKVEKKVDIKKPRQMVEETRNWRGWRAMIRSGYPRKEQAEDERRNILWMS